MAELTIKTHVSWPVGSIEITDGTHKPYIFYADFCDSDVEQDYVDWICEGLPEWFDREGELTQEEIDLIEGAVADLFYEKEDEDYRHSEDFYWDTREDEAVEAFYSCR